MIHFHQTDRQTDRAVLLLPSPWCPNRELLNFDRNSVITFLNFAGLALLNSEVRGVPKQLEHSKDENYHQLYSQFGSVPRSKHNISVIQTSQLMLYREIMAVCSEIHTKHINTLCRLNVELLNVNMAVRIVTIGSDHWAVTFLTTWLFWMSGGKVRHQTPF